MEQVTVINIAWEKIPFDFNIIKEKQSSDDFGLYQIYGHHPVYGEDTLLYIGKAQEQRFGTRLNERWEFVESCARPSFFLIGKIVQSSNTLEQLGWDEKRWGDMIHYAEKILIKAHAPAMNKQENTGVFSKDGIEFGGEHFIVINWGDYGKLLPEISTLRLSYRYWNYEKPLAENTLTTQVEITLTKE